MSYQDLRKIQDSVIEANKNLRDIYVATKESYSLLAETICNTAMLQYSKERVTVKLPLCFGIWHKPVKYLERVSKTAIECRTCCKYCGRV